MIVALPPDDESGRIRNLQSYGILDTAVDEAFDSLTRIAASLCDVPISLVSLVDHDRQWFKSVQGLEGVRQTPRDWSFCAHAILDSNLLEVPDAHLDERFFDNPLVTSAPYIRFYAGAPLIDRAGFRLGTLCVIDQKPRALTQHQREQLFELAKVVTGLLEARKLEGELRCKTRELERNQASLNLVQGITGVGNWELDLTTGDLVWSKALFHILGLEPGSHPPSHDFFLSMVHPEDQVLVKTAIDSAISGVVVPSKLYRVIRPDGAVRLVQSETGMLKLEGDGNARIIGTLQDITEQRAMSRRLRWSEDSLAQAQALAKIGSWELDLLNGTLEWSSGVYNVLGLHPAGHAPTMDDLVRLILDEDREIVSRALLFDTELLDLQSAFDFRIQRPDGNVRFLHLAVVVYRDQDRRPTRAVGTIQDVTAQKLIEAELRDALYASQAADRAKSEFLANMSHELRTPLNAIIGFSEILTRASLAPSMSDRERAYAEDILSSGQHLLSIINDILELSRIDSGHLLLQEEKIETESLLNWTVKLLDQRAAEKNLDVRVIVDPQANFFRADPRLMRQVLLNVVGNAVKFTLEGCITVRALSNNCEGIAIAVDDTGIGMRMEDVPVALTPFSQIENSLQKSYNGIGLGLPIAKRFVELHGGTLSVSSQLRVGTTVTVDLPGRRLAGD